MSDAATPTSSTLPYAIIFAALLALLAATVGLAFIDLGHRWGVTLALTIAATKALLIVLYFMHLRSETWRVAMFAAAGFVWLAILVTLTFGDYFTRNSPGVNPKGEPRYLHAAFDPPAAR